METIAVVHAIANNAQKKQELFFQKRQELFLAKTALLPDCPGDIIGEIIFLGSRTSSLRRAFMLNVFLVLDILLVCISVLITKDACR